MKITIVLPAYNEEANIRQVVNSCIEHLTDHSAVEDFRIIVVNDGSKDMTGTMIDQLAATFINVIAVHKPNGGYGSALRAGFVEASKTGMDWLFFMDADQQFRITEIDKLIKLAQAGNTFIAGWRIDRADTWDRKIKGELWTIACSIVLGQWFHDIDCAFKLVRMNLIGDPKTLKGEGSTINAELILRARRHHGKFARVGVHHYPRGGGESSCTSINFIWQSTISLLKLRMSQSDVSILRSRT